MKTPCVTEPTGVHRGISTGVQQGASTGVHRGAVSDKVAGAAGAACTQLLPLHAGHANEQKRFCTFLVLSLIFRDRALGSQFLKNS